MCTRSFLLLLFFNDTATTEIYTLSLHDALPISLACAAPSARQIWFMMWRARSNGRSEEHTSELQSRVDISYAVFCVKKQKTFGGSREQQTPERHARGSRSSTLE